MCFLRKMAEDGAKRRALPALRVYVRVKRANFGLQIFRSLHRLYCRSIKPVLIPTLSTIYLYFIDEQKN